MRLEWTVKEFYQSDGITGFTNRMAAVLGVHKADIKVVQVYEGSVIVDFKVFAPDDDPEPQTTLESLDSKFVEVVPTLTEDDLGAPVMQIKTTTGTVVAMEGYEHLVEFPAPPSDETRV